MNQFIKQHKTDIAKIAMILLWGITCFAFFQSQFCYHFYYQEQNQLFLLDSNFLSSYFSRPAWFACLLGDFLTQFYYYMVAGPVILTLALLTLGDITRRALERCFHTEDKKSVTEWIAFALAILLMTYEARLCLDQNYRLCSIIAITGGCGMFWMLEFFMSRLFRSKVSLTSVTLYSVLIIACGGLTYYIFGFGFWFFLVLELLRIPTFSRQYELKVWHSAVLMVMGFIPLALFIFVPKTYNLTIADALTYPGMGKWEGFDDAMKFEHVLAFDNEYYFGNYQKVIDMYEHAEGKTDEMTFFYCLVLEQQGLLADKLPSMQNPMLGTFLKIGSDTPLFTIKMINELYYLIGDMTYTERAAIMANTFAPSNRNVRMIKRLAEANLISGDIPAAKKYLRLLSKTMVYGKWARAYTPETMNPNVAAEIARKAAFINKTDQIRLGDDCYAILTQLLDSNPDNMAALDYLLCSDMLAHERETFIRDYEKYNGGRRQIFQEIYNSARQ